MIHAPTLIDDALMALGGSAFVAGLLWDRIKNRLKGHRR